MPKFKFPHTEFKWFNYYKDHSPGDEISRSNERIFSNQFDFIKSEIYLLPNVVDFRRNTLGNQEVMRTHSNIPLFAT